MASKYHHPPLLLFHSQATYTLILERMFELPERRNEKKERKEKADLIHVLPRFQR
jgi:hypothetical protein